MPKKFGPEEKDRAIRMVREHRHDQSALTAACDVLEPQLGIGGQALRRWVAGSMSPPDHY